MKNLNKLLALLLAAVMVLGMMPVPTAHAHVHTHGVEEYPVLALDTLADAVVAEAGTYAYLTFTPEVTDLYHFYSQSDSDTYGILCDAGLNQLTYNDDAAYGNGAGVYSPNFCISYVLEAGVTYVLGARLYSNAAATIPVAVTQGHEYVSEITKAATCAEDGIKTYTCAHCGDSYTEVIPAAHEYDEETGKCIFCDEDYKVTGTCGDNLTWSLDWFGNLVISGTGDMYHYIHTYEQSYPAPWYDYTYSIKSITVEEGVTSVGNYAFNQCGEAKTITLADSVTKLGENSFANCYGMTSIALPSGITEIPASCFRYCGSLEEIQWPENLTVIGDYAFYYCTLGDVAIPEGVTSLGQYVFAGNSNLTKLRLPETLTNVADYAFANMYGIKQFLFKGDAPAFGANTFSYITAEAWYPRENATWTDEVKQNYGGTITWMGLCATHTYGEVVTVPATCDTGSYMTMSCTVCGWTEISPENDDALGHDLIETLIEPDCSKWQNGCIEITCQREGCDYYDARDYKYYWDYHDNETVTVEATCTTDGYSKNICKKCGNEEWLDYFYATGHNVTEWSEPTAATCTEDGTKSGTCANCSETVVEIVEAKLGHEWDMENGTENADGTSTYPCVRCDATYTTEGTYLYVGSNEFTVPKQTESVSKTFTAEANGNVTFDVNTMTYFHEWAQAWNTYAIDWAFRDMGMFTLAINGETVTYTVSGSEVAAHLITPAVAVEAGDVVTFTINHVQANSYIWNYDVKFNVDVTFEGNVHTHAYTAVVTEPTCTEAGFTTYTCECGDSYIADETPALGHTMEARIVFATCTEPGWLGEECTVCGHVEVDYTEPALGHDEVIIPEVPATCTEVGKSEGKQCARCGWLIVTPEETPALGHDYAAVVTEPTCTEEGFTTHTCSRCPDSYVDTQTEALGHDWEGLDCKRCDATRENPFTDVTEGKFYFDAVLWAVENGITSGMGNGIFAPDSNCTRAQIVTFLWRANGCPEPTIDNPFVDVTNPEASYYKAVLWAVENGITTGMTANTFAPGAACTRGQAVTFLWRAMGKPEATQTAHSFTDVSESAFYYKAMLWAVENGITNGTSATSFSPDSNCTRGHIVTFLYRTDKLAAEDSEPEQEPSGQKYQVYFKDDGNGTVICDMTEAAAGEKVIFTAIPDEGYYFSDFVIFDPNGEIDISNIEVFEGEGEHEYYVYMIEYPLLVTCGFKPIPNE